MVWSHRRVAGTRARAQGAPPNGSGTVMTPWNWIVRLVPLVCIGVLASLVSALPVTLAT